MLLPRFRFLAWLHTLVSDFQGGTRRWRGECCPIVAGQDVCAFAACRIVGGGEGVTVYLFSLNKESFGFMEHTQTDSSNTVSRVAKNILPARLMFSLN